jgi:hypothetical protein
MDSNMHLLTLRGDRTAATPLEVELVRHTRFLDHRRRQRATQLHSPHGDWCRFCPPNTTLRLALQSRIGLSVIARNAELQAVAQDDPPLAPEANVNCQMHLSQAPATESFIRRLVRLSQAGKESSLNRAQELVRRRSRQKVVVQKSREETSAWQTNQNGVWVPGRISVHRKPAVISVPPPNHEGNRDAPGHLMVIVICALILNHK